MAVRFGDRLSAARTIRKMKQMDLVRATGLSASTIRKLEQGTRSPSDETLELISAALDVTPETLLGGNRHTASSVHLGVPALRSAIARCDFPEDASPRGLAELRADVERAVRYRLASRYTDLVSVVPGLITDISRAFYMSNDPTSNDQFLRLLISALRCADGVAYKYGYHDLSGQIIDLMRWKSNDLEDPTTKAAVSYVHTETFFVTRDYSTALRLLEFAIDHFPDKSTESYSAALGSLHMRAAVVAARASNSSRAYEHISNARLLAQQVPEGVYAGTAFGPASVRIHETSVAVELGDAPRALSATQSWEPAPNLPAERRSHFYIDLAQAQLWLQRLDDSFASLATARRIAPQHVREHPQVRSTLVRMLRLQRVPRDQVTRFAEWTNAV